MHLYYSPDPMQEVIYILSLKKKLSGSPEMTFS